MILLSALPPATLDLLEAVVLLKYFNFIATTILVYDFILTFADEVRLIWRWEWRIGKILYIATRYSAFIDTTMYIFFWFKKDLSDHGCGVFFDAGSWVSTLGVLIAEWILVSRTFAIWGKARGIVIPLTVMLIAAQIASIYAVHNFLSSLQWTLSPFTSISRCFIIAPKHNFLYVVYIMIMIKELVILVLTAGKGISVWRASHRNSLVHVLYRDGILYFAVLFAITIANFVICVSAKSIVREAFLLEPQRVLHSICTSRIILNLRGATSEHILVGPDFNNNAVGLHSTMDFDRERTKRASLNKRFRMMNTVAVDDEQTMEFQMGTVVSHDIDDIDFVAK